MARMSSAERSRLRKALVIIEGIVDSHETTSLPFDEIDRLAKIAKEIQSEFAI